MGEKLRFWLGENDTESRGSPERSTNRLPILGFPVLISGSGMNEASALSQTRHRLSLFTERQPMRERSAIARLLSQSTQTSKADLVWRKFFSELAIADARDLEIDEPAASIHSYLFRSWLGSRCLAFSQP